MTFIAPLVAGIGTAAASSIGSKLFGSEDAKAPLQNFTPPGFNAGGLTARFTPAGVSVGSSAKRLGLVDAVSGAYGDQASELGLLRAGVAPGISELRASRLSEIENARQSAIGNLRENLQRRRVLGSSFGNDAITRAESEFAGQRERVAAESFLQELQLSNDLLSEEMTARRGQFQTSLNELNLQADIAAKLASGATAALSQNARFLAEMNAKEAAGAGKFFGDVFKPAADAFGTSVGSMFKGA